MCRPYLYTGMPTAAAVGSPVFNPNRAYLTRMAIDETNDNDGEPTVLIPVNAEDAETLPVALVDVLSPLHVVVLGYYPVPSQASPEQLRANHDEEATAATEKAVGQFADRGAAVDSVVVFTHDHAETIDHIAVEYGVDAVLTPGDSGETFSRLLVPVRGDENLERIVSFVADLLGASDATATLYNVDTDDETSHGEFLLRGACDRLAEIGIDPDRVDWQVDQRGSPGDAIVETAEEYDMLVVGESEPSLRDRIFGRMTGQLVDRVGRPVLVVRDA